MKIYCLQHASFEGPGGIEVWAKDRGHKFKSIKLFELEVVPDSLPDLLVVVGGPMNVDEDSSCPWLRDEKKYVLSAIHSQKHVLGICLGAQLIAKVLGGEVRQNAEPEIGWFPIQWNDKVKKLPCLDHASLDFVPFHWHFDRYELPPGGISIASSSGCDNQAFIVGDRVVGFQFHPEMTKENIETMIAHCSSDLASRKYIQQPAEMLPQPEKLNASRAFLYQFLDRFCQ